MWRETRAKPGPPTTWPLLGGAPASAGESPGDGEKPLNFRHPPKQSDGPGPLVLNNSHTHTAVSPGPFKAEALPERMHSDT